MPEDQSKTRHKTGMADLGNSASCELGACSERSVAAALVALGMQSHSPCSASMMLSTPQNHSFLTLQFGLGHEGNLK